MSRPGIYITQGSYGEAWAIQILDGLGQPVDLTDATGILFSMRLRSSGVVHISDQPAEVAIGTYTLPDGSVQTFAATDGVLVYRPKSADGDADVAGAFEAMFRYSLPTGSVGKPGLGYLNIHIQAAF